MIIWLLSANNSWLFIWWFIYLFWSFAWIFSDHLKLFANYLTIKSWLFAKIAGYCEFSKWSHFGTPDQRAKSSLAPPLLKPVTVSLDSEDEHWNWNYPQLNFQVWNLQQIWYWSYWTWLERRMRCCCTALLHCETNMAGPPAPIAIQGPTGFLNWAFKCQAVWGSSTEAESYSSYLYLIQCII